MMCRQPRIREETVEVIQLIPQSQIPDHAKEQIVDVPVPRNFEEIGERIFDHQRLLLQQGNFSPRANFEFFRYPQQNQVRVYHRSREDRGPTKFLHQDHPRQGRFHHHDVTDGMQLSWKIPVDVVSKNFLEVIKVDRQLESTVQPLVGLDIHSLGIEDVDHDALRLAIFEGGWAAGSICAGLFGAG